MEKLWDTLHDRCLELEHISEIDCVQRFEPTDRCTGPDVHVDKFNNILLEAPLLPESLSQLDALWALTNTNLLRGPVLVPCVALNTDGTTSWPIRGRDAGTGDSDVL